MIEIPRVFKEETIQREGEAGRDWLDLLPRKIDSVIQRWNLKIDGSAMHGYLALVIPVTSGKSEYALKITWRDEFTRNEGAALEAWNGNGAVKLIKHDENEGALLLERLDSEKTLETLRPDAAIKIAGGLLRRLAIPAPDFAISIEKETQNTLNEIFSDYDETGQTFPIAGVEKATSIRKDLLESPDSVLVNQDLHYGNVLAGEREPWLVIDPKVLKGDLEYGAAQLLWQEFAAIESKSSFQVMFKTLVDSAGLDEKRASGWTFFRCVAMSLWSLKYGFKNGAARSARILEWI